MIRKGNQIGHFVQATGVVADINGLVTNNNNEFNYCIVGKYEQPSLESPQKRSNNASTKNSRRIVQI